MTYLAVGLASHFTDDAEGSVTWWRQSHSLSVMAARCHLPILSRTSYFSLSAAAAAGSVPAGAAVVFPDIVMLFPILCSFQCSILFSLLFQETSDSGVCYCCAIECRIVTLGAAAK